MLQRKIRVCFLQNAVLVYLTESPTNSRQEQQTLVTQNKGHGEAGRSLPSANTFCVQARALCA